MPQSTPVTILGTDNATPASAANPVAVLGGVDYSPVAAQLTSGVINLSGPGTGTVIAAGTGTASKIYQMFFTVSSATLLTVFNGNTALSGPLSFTANGGLILDYNGEPWFTGSSSAVFSFNTNTTSQVSGRVYYIQS